MTGCQRAHLLFGCQKRYWTWLASALLPGPLSAWAAVRAHVSCRARSARLRSGNKDWHITCGVRNGGVDPDQPALAVQEHAARVARVDGCTQQLRHQTTGTAAVSRWGQGEVKICRIDSGARLRLSGSRS